MSQSAPKAQISKTPLPRERSALVQTLLGDVERIVPIIARNKAASEHARTLAPEVVEAMRDTGLLMMKSPYEVGGAVMLDDPLQRILRDLYTAQSHLMVSDAAYEALGKLRLGLTDKAPIR